jgi:hypothetical protein
MNTTQENVFNPNFSGGFSRFTNGDGASVSLSFHGTPLPLPIFFF